MKISSRYFYDRYQSYYLILYTFFYLFQFWRFYRYLNNFYLFVVYAIVFQDGSTVLPFILYILTSPVHFSNFKYIVICFYFIQIRVEFSIKKLYYLVKFNNPTSRWINKFCFINLYIAFLTKQATKPSHRNYNRTAKSAIVLYNVQSQFSLFIHLRTFSSVSIGVFGNGFSRRLGRRGM